jgi:hypothetical protein
MVIGTWCILMGGMRLDIMRGEISNIIIDIKLASIQRLRAVDADSIKSTIISLSFCRYEYFQERMETIIKRSAHLAQNDRCKIFYVVENYLRSLSFIRRWKAEKTWKELLKNKEYLFKEEKAKNSIDIIHNIIATHE